MTNPGTTESPVARLSLDISGPFDLGEVATMGFGHRDEKTFDGVMRMAFGLDGDVERQVGVSARQDGDVVALEAVPVPGQPPLTPAELDRVRAQVARVISLDHDGAAFDALCASDPVLAEIHHRAPGFRPALFYSPYDAAAWSVISARRARSQGIGLRNRIAEQHGATVDLAGVSTSVFPTPGQLLRMDSAPGLSADRIPRLHAIAEAAQRGDLDATRLRSLDPDDAMTQLQQLPGIGPFYSALIVVRACGHADVPSLAEAHSRDSARELYGIDHQLSDAEFTDLTDSWRPFRTWVAVMLRALGDRPSG